MKQISQTDLAIHIHVILTCMPKTDRNAGGWRSEQAVRAATAKIMELLERTVILKPDDVLASRGDALAPMSYKPGEFGLTEPGPFEPGCRPPATPKPPSKSNAG